MNRAELSQLITERKTPLCIGLDTDIDKIPAFLKKYDNPVLEFNKLIIDATRDLCVAYKPNLAFYEVMGAAGWQTLKDTVAYIGDEHFTIADAKRGDIGNTATMYARAFFEDMNFSAVTVAPYMGEDSVTPFLQYPGKWAIVLGLTSNAGSMDFQMSALEDGEPLYAKVLRKVSSWGTTDNTMFVIGATHPEKLAQVRNLAPEHFFLVPGVGAQGGDFNAVLQAGGTSFGGLLINSSREILYASSGEDFAEQARMKAAKYVG